MIRAEFHRSDSNQVSTGKRVTRARARTDTPWWSREDILLVLLVGLLFYLPGLGRVSLFDRDEPRFASAARTMLATGDYVVPHFNGALRPDKPPLVYWLMAASYRVVGENELGARLPSALTAALTLLVVYFAAGARFGRVTGLLAAVLLGSTGLFVALARLATADATQILFTTLSLACAWRAWDSGSAEPQGILSRPRYLVDEPGALDHTGRLVRTGPVPFGVALLFWVSLALGALTKGVPLLFVLVPMLTLSVATAEAWGKWRQYRWGARVYHLPQVLFTAVVRGNWGWWRGLRPLLGVPLLVVLVGWWVVWAGLATNWVLIEQMVGVHFVVRAAGPLLDLLHIRYTDVGGPGGNDPMRAYGYPPGFYLALVWVTFFPWTVLLIPAAYHAAKRMLGRTAVAIDPRPYQFLVAWVVPMWILLELSRGKLLHYVLPLYVPLAIVAADTLVQSWHRMTDVLAARWLRGANWVLLAVWLLLAAAAVALPRALVHNPQEITWLSIPLAGALAATGVASFLAWQRPAWPFVVALGWGAALMFGATLLLPAVSELAVSKNALAVARLAEQRGFAVGAVGYDQPTLVWYFDHPRAVLPLWGADRVGDLEKVFAPGAKRRGEDGAPAGQFGTPDVATAAIVSQKVRTALDAAGVHYVLLGAYQGFRTDSVGTLLNAVRAWFGKPPQRVAAFTVSVIANDRPFPEPVAKPTSLPWPGTARPE
jgi:4-amino-4-deoxy-L-arabinose transferase-like glycosyltransferase